MVEKEKLIRIVTQTQQGDESGASELYSTFHDDIYYFILKTVSDPDLAADLTQDTFMEILQTIGQLKEPAAFVTWSRQIAYHRCTAHFRKRKELLADEDEDGYSIFDTVEEDRTEFIPDAALDQADLKATIHAMIDSLPEEQRSALLMRYFEELPVSKIAEIQGVSEGTVKSRLNYGRKTIGKAVEDYEKKNGVKLHCVGVVPLLLWLAARVSKESATGTAVAGAATVAGASTSAAAAASTSAASVGGGIALKVAAGIAALAVLAGGITAAVLPRGDDEPERAASANTEVVEDPMEWYGFGSDRGVDNPKYFEMTITSMDDSEIAGHLEVSHLYETTHDTDFTGTGSTNEDGTIQYALRFETPVTMGVSSYEYWEMTMTYDPKTKDFLFDCDYYVTLARRRAEPEEIILSTDESWSGDGKCDFCYGSETPHVFSLEIDRMTDTGISGVLTVTRDGETEHASAFTGRGYLTETGASYEVRLSNPKTDIVWMSERTVEIFRIHYDKAADTLTIEDIVYSACCNKN